jgi:hypothetical protein
VVECLPSLGFHPQRCKEKTKSQGWPHIPVIPALRSLRQEDQEFEVISCFPEKRKLKCQVQNAEPQVPLTPAQSEPAFHKLPSEVCAQESVRSTRLGELISECHVLMAAHSMSEKDEPGIWGLQVSIAPLPPSHACVSLLAEESDTCNLNKEDLPFPQDSPPALLCQPDLSGDGVLMMSGPVAFLSLQLPSLGCV